MAISGVHSFYYTEQEQEAKKLVEEAFKAANLEVRVSLSSELGEANMLLRENVALLNACLRPLVKTPTT